MLIQFQLILMYIVYSQSGSLDGIDTIGNTAGSWTDTYQDILKQSLRALQDTNIILTLSC